MVIFSPCPIVGAPVRPNMLNMPTSASAWTSGRKSMLVGWLESLFSTNTAISETKSLLVGVTYERPQFDMNERSWLIVGRLRGLAACAARSKTSSCVVRWMNLRASWIVVSPADTCVAVRSLIRRAHIHWSCAVVNLIASRAQFQSRQHLRRPGRRWRTAW